MVMVIGGIGNSANAAPQQYAVKRGEASVASSDPLRAKPAGESGRESQGAQQTAEQQRTQQQVQQLKAQEEKIKAHEAAHKSAGGQYASSATYSYRPGPDGRSYIVGGEVQIDMSPGKTPQETVAKMQIVQRAALAPADPSGQDRAVAAQAAAIAIQAQQEQMQQANEELADASPAPGSASPATGNTPPTTANGVTAEALPGVESNSTVQAAPAAAKQEETVAARMRVDLEIETRQIASYKANTTPGDIFAPQKMSTYA